MCQALVSKKVWAYIFMKTYLLVACCQAVFYDDYDLDTKLLVFVNFLQL